MKRNEWVSVLSIILMMIIGCEDEPTVPKENYTYPLSIGNRWEYHRDFTYCSYSDSTQTDTCGIISGYDTCSVIVVQETTLLDTIETIQLMEQTWEDSSIFVGLYYYEERDTGLFLIAYLNPYSSALPKSINRSNFLNEPLIPKHLKELYYGKLTRLNKLSENGKLYYEDPPVYSLKYPLEIGSYWTYRQEGHPWRMDRKVIQDTTITVPAGTFKCYQLRMDYMISETNVRIDDFIADEGLILRKVYLEGEVWDEYGNLLYSKLDDEYKLMNYELR
ncbi:MAG: hypothetical protein L6422_11950 [Candidatus Marinimicrobia bacterium]|nr:hypothetical protein [Candidatus Neomarinimicrobiota bacterium]